MQLIDDPRNYVYRKRTQKETHSEHVCEDNRLHINILKYARIDSRFSRFLRVTSQRIVYVPARCNVKSRNRRRSNDPRP